jgi:hypothetical protein
LRNFILAPPRFCALGSCDSNKERELRREIYFYFHLGCFPFSIIIRRISPAFLARSVLLCSRQEGISGENPRRIIHVLEIIETKNG